MCDLGRLHRYIVVVSACRLSTFLRVAVSQLHGVAVLINLAVFRRCGGKLSAQTAALESHVDL